MYVGHFATGVAIKALSPKTPTWPIILGVTFMDLVYGVFVILGIDHVTPNLGSGPYLYFDLTFIDWDHSLLMALVLSLVWALFFIRNRTTAWIAGLAVFSHFLLDWPMHNRDLALYPYSEVHLGGGLWGLLGTSSWILEGVFSAGLFVFAWQRLKRNGIFLVWPGVLMLGLFLQLSPWLSPMKFVARLDEPAIHLLHGILIIIGFMVPGLVLARMIDRGKHV